MNTKKNALEPKMVFVNEVFSNQMMKKNREKATIHLVTSGNNLMNAINTNRNKAIQVIDIIANRIKSEKKIASVCKDGFYLNLDWRWLEFTPQAKT